MVCVLRILDANANRAREALRVMEEAARFLLNDGVLSGRLKALRHQLAEAVKRLPVLEHSRNTPGDVGTGITTSSELQRRSSWDVVVAAGKRLSEALRVLEEYTKTLGAGFIRVAGQIQRIRYRGYELERQLHQLFGSSQPGRQWHLAVLLSEGLCPAGDWMKVAKAVVKAARDSKQASYLCLQLREKEMDARFLERRARQLVELCRPEGISVIVNDRPDVALAAEADGVHVGQTDISCAQIRRWFGHQMIVGVSTSRLSQVRQALGSGADYVGLGPMFRTTTKRKKTIAGPGYLRAFLKAFDSRLPALAIGGITPANLSQLLESGVRGVAVSSAVCSASDPYGVAQFFLEALAEPVGKVGVLKKGLGR